jgi:hypothetical protein
VEADPAEQPEVERQARAADVAVAVAPVEVAAAIRPAGRAILLAWIAAIGLAPLLAVPVTWALQQPPQLPDGFTYAWSPVDPVELYVCVAVAAMISAAVGAGLGGLVAHRFATLGALVAVVVGWTIAVSFTTVMTASLFVPLEAAVLCIDGCGPFITGYETQSAIMSLALGWILSAGSIVLPVAAIALVAGAAFANRRRHPVLATVIILIGWSFMNFWALLSGGAIPYAAFVVGVVSWAWILYQPRFIAQITRDT